MTTPTFRLFVSSKAIRPSVATQQAAKKALALKHSDPAAHAELNRANKSH